MSVGSNVAYASGWNGSPGCTVAFPSRSVRTSATLRVISISRSVGRGISTSTPSSSSTLARAARIPASLISWSGETVNRGIRRFGLGTVIEPSASWPPSRGKPRRQRYATRYRLQSGGRGRFLDESRSAFGLGYTEPRSFEHVDSKERDELRQPRRVHDLRRPSRPEAVADRLREVWADARRALRPRAREDERQQGCAPPTPARDVPLPRADAAG